MRDRNPGGLWDAYDLKVICAVPLADEPAQYSLHEQLAVLREIALRMKLYDAHEFLQKVIGK